MLALRFLLKRLQIKGEETVPGVSASKEGVVQYVYFHDTLYIVIQLKKRNK